MEQNMTNTNANTEWVGRYPFSLHKHLVDTVTKEGDHLLFELGHALSQITVCEVQCENPIFVTGETLPELSAPPEDIVWNLKTANIRLPDSIRESLKEYKDKLVPYTSKNTLNNEERDKVAEHICGLRHFLFEEVIKPALKNTYPAIEGK